MDNLTNNEKIEVKKPSTENKRNAYEIENFVRVQDYTGEGYKLRDSRPETGKLAEEHRGEIEEAVQKYFLSTYKTEVIVHNIIGAVDGATIFVESVGEPHFYTYAIIPIDVDSETVETDEVWSEEGQVENAIQGALYAMIYEQEFATLDEYLESILQKYPVVGVPIEAIEKVGGSGFSSSVYRTSKLGNEFQGIYDMYLENPEISKEEIKKNLSKADFKPDQMLILIELFMKESDTEPDQAVFDKIVSDINELEGIPRGAYTIILNDNLIDKRRGIGTKDNTLESMNPNEILKE
ncbi:DUF1672 family protein [Sporosarcina psychrophila]|uniref:DUF1672 family protein n=1 Tax=Sporosarcina psychrophila TaxID=1476 RepID=UPI0030D5CD31